MLGVEIVLLLEAFLLDGAFLSDRMLVFPLIFLSCHTSMEDANEIGGRLLGFVAELDYSSIED